MAETPAFKKKKPRPYRSGIKLHIQRLSGSCLRSISILVLTLPKAGWTDLDTRLFHMFTPNPVTTYATCISFVCLEFNRIIIKDFH